MKNFKSMQYILAIINVVFGIIAFYGFFDGKDLLPIVISCVMVLIGLIILLIKRKKSFNHQVIGFGLVVLSAVGLYHIHFNIYNANKINESRENSMQVLKGEQAPSLSFKYNYNTLKGESIQTYMGSKNFVILNFWATWCAPCLKEMPLLNDFHKAYNDQEVAVIGFTDFKSGNDKQLDKINKVLLKLNISYPILIDSSTNVRVAYKADVLPSTVLIDSEGKVIDYQIGIDGAKKIMEYVKSNLKMNP